MQEIVFERLEHIDYNRSEAYKSIRANIQFTDANSKVICFTSATAAEGKTTTVINMARTFAKAGQKVLFVDADLRRSVVAERYETDKIAVGLTQFLKADAKADDIVYKTNVENLYMIPTGKRPGNPSELLGSNAFKTLMDELKEQYDYVLVDTAPLGLVIDAALIAVHCDGAVVIVEHDKIGRRAAMKVVEQLKQSGCQIMGGIMTKMPYVGMEYGYGRYRSRIYSRYYERYYGRYHGSYEYGHMEDEHNESKASK